MKQKRSVFWNYLPHPQECGSVGLKATAQEAMAYAEKVAEQCGKYFPAKSARLVDGDWLIDRMDYDFPDLDLNF